MHCIYVCLLIHIANDSRKPCWETMCYTDSNTINYMSIYSEVQGMYILWSKLFVHVLHVTLLLQAQLCKELNEEKFKNQLLTRFVMIVHLLTAIAISLVYSRKLQEACQQKPQVGSHKIFHGQKLNRSMSIAWCLLTLQCIFFSFFE